MLKFVASGIVQSGKIVFPMRLSNDPNTQWPNRKKIMEFFASLKKAWGARVVVRKPVGHDVNVEISMV